MEPYLYSTFVRQTFQSQKFTPQGKFYQEAAMITESYKIQKFLNRNYTILSQLLPHNNAPTNLVTKIASIYFQQSAHRYLTWKMPNFVIQLSTVQTRETDSFRLSSDQVLANTRVRFCREKSHILETVLKKKNTQRGT